ncbi:unnamed protein product [Blepharisma stoltei]|uniref:Calponin-homology (CH) domain-containing protein n=1 Tax=Blepharisma stoltei TaxID=1481888 RepID=A0AAU9J147_9CILI|nr:unnamed protein product [Blepharisma stoltei]
MDEIEKSLVIWINEMKLNKLCNNFSELSDGVLLYELMSKVSPDYFDLDSITIDAHDNWALKLANLRRLKKTIDNYLDKELRVNHEKYDQIELATIARKSGQEELLKLMELVMFAILNCEEKETFINPIMKLDEKCQTNLMIFIKNILGEDDSGSAEESKISSKEINRLREEKSKLVRKISTMQKELSALNEQKSSILSERDELKVINVGLENELIRKSASCAIPSEFFDLRVEEIRNKERAENLSFIIKSEIDDVKKEYEAEIANLKDELDVANSNLCKLAQTEKTLQDYKKKIEKNSAIVKKYSDLVKQHESLEGRYKQLLEENNELGKLRQNIVYLKDQFSREKDKSESLAFALENKEKQIKRLNKKAEELSEKLEFAESRLQECQNLNEINSAASEDSFIYRVESEDLKLELSRAGSRKFTTLGQEQLDLCQREKIVFKNKYEKAKQKQRQLSESIKMLKEEYDTQKYNDSMYTQRLLKQIDAVTDQMKVVSDSVSNSQSYRLKNEQLFYEIEGMKATKDALMQDVKKLHEEKDLMYKRFIECREETINLQSTINKNELKIKELLLSEKLLNDKVREHSDKEKWYTESIESLKKQKQAENEDCSLKLFDLEREIITLKSENGSLLIRLHDKEDRIQEILKDKTDTIQILEAQHSEAINKLKNDNDWKQNQMVKQAEEAMLELQNERELLIAKLKYERNSGMNEWKRMNTMREQPYPEHAEDVMNLKKKLEEKEKQLADSHKMNKELKRCWKEAATLLKVVYKEMGKEARKLNAVSKIEY